MTEATPTARVVRFGTFEADLRAGELRKNGMKIKLQEQPFQILAMLVVRPGEVVTPSVSPPRKTPPVGRERRSEWRATWVFRV